MKNYTITNNKQYNSIEISFTSKPSAEVREVLKSFRFRWHKARRIWYGYADAAKISEALEAVSASPIETTAPAETPTPAAKAPAKKAAEKINIEGLAEMAENNPMKWGAELAAQIRQALKERGAKGYTVRAGRGCNSICLTVSLTSADFRSVDELVRRFGWSSFFRAQEYGVTVNGIEYHYRGSNKITCGDDEHAEVLRQYWRDRITDYNYVHDCGRCGDVSEEYNEVLTPEALERIQAIYKIANAWNFDHSDPMTDYFCVGYYFDMPIKICGALEIREHMTTEEAAQLQADLDRKEKEEAERLAAWKKEEEENRKAAEEYERKHAAMVETVKNGATVEDLEEFRRYFVRDLLEPLWNKENTIEEYRAQLNGEREGAPAPVRTDAQIFREVRFTPEAFEAFSQMFLTDFDFLAGFGGSATDDPRINDINDFYTMTAEERKTVKWYQTNCVAVYCENVLRLVIDPQGHNYARYVFFPDELTTSEKLEEAEPEAPEAENLETLTNPQDLSAAYFFQVLTAQLKHCEEKPGDIAQAAYYRGMYAAAELLATGAGLTDSPFFDRLSDFPKVPNSKNPRRLS